MKCQARVIRRYKTRKADVVWPESVYGLVPEHVAMTDVCGGDVTVTIGLEPDGAYGDPDCCPQGEHLAAEWTCTRCCQPYVPGRFEFEAAVSRGAVSDQDFAALAKAAQGGPA